MTDAGNTTSINSRDRYLEEAEDILQDLSAEELAHILRSKANAEEQVSLPEAGGSCNVFMLGPGGSEIQITSRALSIETAWENMVRFVGARIAEGYHPVVKYGVNKALMPSGPASNKQEPVTKDNKPFEVVYNDPKEEQKAQAQQLGVMEFVVDSIDVGFFNNKPTFKLKGGQWSRFGLTIYPEVFERAGIDVNALQSGAVDKSKLLLIATYEEKPKTDGSGGVTRKVIGLRRAAV